MASSPENFEISSPRKRDFRHSEAECQRVLISRILKLVVTWL